MPDRPLVQKLGFKPGHRVKTWGAPDDYLELLSPMPESIEVADDLTTPVDVVHLFTASRTELEHLLPALKSEIRQNGMIWISWPKKSSDIPSEVNGDVIRQVALPMGLVDVKICAVDDVWSGLKLMIRRELRR